MTAPLVVGHQLVADILTQEIIDGAISVTSTARLACSNGTSNHRPRKLVRIYNNGTATIYWGGTGVTVLTGEPISVGEGVCVAAAELCDVYLVAESGSHNCRIKEGF